MVMSTFQRHYLLVLDCVYAFTYQEFDITSIAYLHCRNAHAGLDCVYTRNNKAIQLIPKVALGLLYEKQVCCMICKSMKYKYK